MVLFVLNFPQDILLSEIGNIQNSVHVVYFFKKTTETCLHMTRVIAGLHSKLDKGGCLGDGEGARPPVFFL